MLRSRNSLDIHRIREIAEILICLADTVMLRMVAILDVSHTPGIITDKLEGKLPSVSLLPSKLTKSSSTGAPQPWVRYLLVAVKIPLFPPSFLMSMW
jgi:hypothetical protein